MAEYTDTPLVESLLRNALGYGSKPELDDEQYEQLVTLAMVGGTASSESLQRAATVGWGWKSGLTADQYDLKGASGASLTRHQWFDQCRLMAESYKNGSLSVDGVTFGTDLGVDASALCDETTLYLGYLQ